MPRGGPRVGAGRPKGSGKPKGAAAFREPAESVRTGDDAAPVGQTPLEYMLAVMNDPDADKGRRDRLAVAAAPYLHPKKGEGGKKEELGGKADRAARGKFAAAAPPKLVVNNR